MAESRSKEAEWYVAHTYAGYENKVKLDIEQSIKNRGMENLIFEVEVPTQMVTELKKDKERKYEKKLFPGYVLVKMIMTDDTWYVIRNTRGVTGFVGPDNSNPVPISKEEWERIHGKTDTIIRKLDVEVGDMISVTAGPFKDTIANVLAVNESKKTVSIEVDFMGGVRNLEVGFDEIKKYE